MTPEELEETLIASGFDKAFKDYRYYQDHLNRKVGKPTESLQLTGANGGPIETNHTISVIPLVQAKKLE